MTFLSDNIKGWLLAIVIGLAAVFFWLIVLILLSAILPLWVIKIIIVITMMCLVGMAIKNETDINNGAY